MQTVCAHPKTFASMLSALRSTSRVALRQTVRFKTHYSIVRVDVHDDEAYGKYAAIAGPTVEKYGGKFLARGE